MVRKYKVKKKLAYIKKKHLNIERLFNMKKTYVFVKVQVEVFFKIIILL